MRDVAAMVSSRICHDLINPLGAIDNGMEFMAMGHAGLDRSEEFALISQSVASAIARVRQMRLAFGAAAPGAEIARDEITGVFNGVYGAGRLTVTADLPVALPRPLVKALLLAVMCAETGLPRGGTMRVSTTDEGVRIAADGPRVTMPPDLWQPLAHGQPPTIELRPAEVQFALLPQALTDAGRKMTLLQHETGVTMVF